MPRGAAGMTAFLVEKGAPGFNVGGKLEVIGIRGTGTAELMFKDCTVPGANMLGSAGDGFLIAMAVVFQMPTIVFFLAKMKLITARFLLRQFKYAVLIIFIISAPVLSAAVL